MYLCLILLSLVSTVVTLRRTDLFVNYAEGRDNSTCGGRTTPCKTLRVAVNKVEQSGTVYISGSQCITETIPINKSVTVRGLNSKGASIFQCNGTRIVTHVFWIVKHVNDINNVSLMSLQLHAIGLVYLASSASVAILKCAFYGRIPANKFTPYIDLDATRNSQTTFNITDSSFIQTNPIRMVYISKTTMANCVFENTIIFFQSVNTAKILNSTFYNTLSFSFRRVSNVHIYRCTFVSLHLYIEWRTENVAISYTMFDRSAVKVVGCRSLAMTRCLFSNTTIDPRSLDPLEPKSPIHLVGSRMNVDINDVVCQYNRVESCGCLRLKGVRSAIIRRLKSQYNVAGANSGGMCVDETSTVRIMGCSFSQNRAQQAGALYIIKSSVKVNASLFFGNSVAENGGSMSVENSNVKVTASLFARSSSVTTGGAISSKHSRVTFTTTTFSFCSANRGGAMGMVESTLEVNQCILKKNMAKFGASAIHMLSQRKASIQNTYFINCTAPTLYISVQTIVMSNTTFSATSDSPRYHIELEGDFIRMQSVHTNMSYPTSAASNTIQNLLTVKSSSAINISDGLNVTCSPYFNIEMQTEASTENKTNRFKVRCVTCHPNMYSLANTLQVRDLTALRPTPKCMPCPAGAVCNGYIKALDNYWGAEGEGNDLAMLPCPPGYCCASQSTPCVSYKTCRKGRRGTLCGSCNDDHVQSFISDECLPKGTTQCNLAVFVLWFEMVSLLYSVILTFLPTIMESVKTVVSKCKKTPDDNGLNENDPEDSADVAGIVEAEAENKPVPITAAVTQIIFYFQLASIVHIDILSRRKATTSPEDDSQINKVIFDAFNFRFSLYREVCPMDNLTLIVKLFINMGLKINMSLNLVWFYVLWKCYTFIVTCQGSKTDSAESTRGGQSEMEIPELNPTSACANQHEVVVIDENASSDERRSLSFVSLLKIGFIKLVKLNFTSTVVILLQLVHCETAHNHLHLYVYGDHICYVWWQYLILIIFIPTLALFPLSFGMALNLLKKRIISTNTFMLSCLMPFIPFLVCIKGKCHQLTKKKYNENEEMCAREILECEEELFSAENKGLRWPVIQLYRNLLIVLLSTFILNPLFRSLLFLVIFNAFFVHDGYRMPFEHPYLNQLQRLTSVCLFLVNVCNIPSSFSSVGNLMTVPKMEICLAILRYAEMCLYAIVPLSFPVWKLWERCGDRMKRDKKDT